MTPDKLIYMANQIAAFFASQPEEERIAGVAEHLNDFWDPRMRERLLALDAESRARLDPLVQEAMKRLAPAGEAAQA